MDLDRCLDRPSGGLPASAANGYPAGSPAARPSLNPKQRVLSCRSSRNSEPAAAWLQRNPQVRFVDLLLADQMGIPRGKRVTAAELAGVHSTGPAAAGLDVRARRARRHGAVRPASASTKATPTASACRSRARWCRCPGSASTSRRCRSACTSTTARRSTATRATCSRTSSRASPRSACTPVMAVELEFYLVDRERTRAGPRAAAAPAADRPPRDQDADQLDAGARRVLRGARRDRRPPRARRSCRPARSWRSTARASSR